MNTRLLLIITAILFTGISPAIAKEQATKEHGTKLNIFATEQTEIQQDLLIASLRFEYEAKTAHIVQNEINQKMTNVLDLAKQFNDVQAYTEQYSVYKYHYPRKKGEVQKIMWRGQQSLKLKSKSVDDLLKLTGKLQDIGLVMSNLHYSVSSNKFENTRDSLMEKAIEKLLNKAKRVAKSIGKTKVEVLQMNVGANNFYPTPQPMRMLSMDAVKAEMATPVAAPGQSNVGITVSATILLQD